MKKKACLDCKDKGCCPCPDCKDANSPPCKELENKYGLRKWSIGIISGVVLVGCLGPFIAQCILPFFVPCCSINGLEMWNQYVGIILGVVATILSIVSLVMSFHSSDEAYIQQREAFDRYKSTVDLIEKLDRHISDFENRSVGMSKPIDTVSSPQTGDEKPTTNKNDVGVD